MSIGNKLVTIITLILVSACSFNNNQSNTEKVDTHFSGAYAFPDGTIFTLGYSNEERMRMLRFKDGQPYSLYHNGDNQFNVTKGFSSKETVATGELTYSPSGEVTGATWAEGNEELTIERLPLTKQTMYFQSGELKLRGELTLPAGEGPFPVVIMVHGSEDYSAVDYYQWPYILAAHGIAGFKFDKRGTGSSEGEYTQHFPTLAGDVVAAIERLKKEQELSLIHI